MCFFFTSVIFPMLLKSLSWLCQAIIAERLSEKTKTMDFVTLEFLSSFQKWQFYHLYSRIAWAYIYHFFSPWKTKYPIGSLWETVQAGSPSMIPFRYWNYLKCEHCRVSHLNRLFNSFCAWDISSGKDFLSAWDIWYKLIQRICLWIAWTLCTCCPIPVLLYSLQ